MPAQNEVLSGGHTVVNKQERVCNGDCPLFGMDLPLHWVACKLYNHPVIEGHPCSFDRVFEGREEIISQWLLATRTKTV